MPASRCGRAAVDLLEIQRRPKHFLSYKK
jgi:hypothetical protein